MDAASPDPQIILYRRADCSACDRAAEAVRSIAAALNLPWAEREVDDENAARVPIVALRRGGEETELAAERVNPAALARDLRAALSAPRPAPQADLPD